MTRRIVIALAICAGLLTAVGIASNTEPFEFDTGDSTAALPGAGRADAVDRPAASTPEVEETVEEPTERAHLPHWLAWTSAIIGAIAVLLFFSRQRIAVLFRRRRPSRESAPITSEQEQASAIAEFADDLIAEFDLGGDPRTAIQRVYAAVETGFGFREMRRKPAETPLRYLDRIFGRRAAAAEPLGRLTDHFQIARFSDEPVTIAMRDDAIDALREIRDEYRAVGRAVVRTR